MYIVEVHHYIIFTFIQAISIKLWTGNYLWWDLESVSTQFVHVSMLPHMVEFCHIFWTSA